MLTISWNGFDVQVDRITVRLQPNANAIFSAPTARHLAGTVFQQNQLFVFNPVHLCSTRFRWMHFRATPARCMAPVNVTVHVPSSLRDGCGGASELALSAANVRTLLEMLERRYPALHGSICDETGAVRRHVNVFVNDRHTRDCNGLDTVLEAGDVVTILPAVSGG